MLQDCATCAKHPASILVRGGGMVALRAVWKFLVRFIEVEGVFTPHSRFVL